MPRTAQPSNLELQALTVLWNCGQATVATVREALPDGRQRAYTTVLTVMQNLERKNLVKRRLEGRAHVYEPACSRDLITSQATSHYLTNVFGGRLDEAVFAILSAGILTPEEKTNIEQQLKQHRTMPAKKATKKVAKKAAKKAAPAKKVAKKVAPAKKAAKKTVAKKAAPVKKVAKKAAVKKTAKKAAKKAK
jgi:predicted transcriptional regulator